MDGSEITRERYKTFAKWVKEVAFLLFAALVVQNIVKGASLSDAYVVVGFIASFATYAVAVYLMYQP